MEVEFRNSKLKKRYKQSSQAQKAWGKIVARNYIKAVNSIYAVDKQADLHDISQLDFHPLGGDRKGQFGIELGERARLILKFRHRGVVEVAIVFDVDPRHYGN